MSRLLTIAILHCFLNHVFFYFSTMDKIIGTCRSTKSYHRVPLLKYVFNKDSTFIETVSGSIGAISSHSNCYFLDSNVIVLSGIGKSKVVFIGSNKLKFLSIKNDSVQSLMYRLRFKRE